MRHLLIALLIALLPMVSLAQEADDAGGGDGGANAEQAEGEGEEGAEEETDFFTSGTEVVTDSFWRFTFYEVTAQRFAGDHPFYKMTDSKFFEEGRTAANSTTDNTGFLINGVDPIMGQLNHDIDQSFWIRLVHGIPPMSLEYVMPTDSFAFPAIGIEGYYTNTWLTDNVAAVGKEQQRDTPIVRLRAHYYMTSVTTRILFPPGKGGTEIIYGIGFAHLETTMKWGFRRAGLSAELRRQLRRKIITDIRRNTSATPIPFQKIGIASSGDNFGVSLTLYLMGSDSTIKNPFHNHRYISPKPQQKTVSLEGLIMRIGVFYNFWG